MNSNTIFWARTIIMLVLGASAWHFGTEDAPDQASAGILAHGGLPIAMPLLVHPAATLDVLGTIAETPITEPGWLHAGTLAWLVLAMAWAGTMVARGRWWAPVRLVMLAGLFVACPPLVAFAVYFVCVHAPAHTAALIANPRRAPRVHGAGSAVLRALPITVLTLMLGALLWPFYPGAAAPRLLALTIQCFAALTLPHMLLDAWLTAREARAA